ncbi:3-dehydroquinate synthase [Aggregatilineales bacterium SYSU G02658]
MERIPVTTPDGAYDILIGSGLLGDVVAHPERYDLSARPAVITDTNVAHLYGAPWVQQTPQAALIVMPAGEQHKTLDTVRMLYDQLVTARADRSTTIVALGGGVVGDTAGFAAATYMRGLRLVQIPTTLLAMVDSSVGGKVGVDLPQGKNLVGAFKQPSLVLIDPNVLTTLPSVEWQAGMAEVIKHGLLADSSLLDPALHTPERTTELIARAVRVKVDIVQQDPFEHGIRAHLNLGHTFGHAIEQVTQYRWLHGFAVAAGLVAALRLSLRLGMIDEQLVMQVEGILRSIGLPTRMGALDPQALYDAMATDKKWRAGASRFVLLKGVCEPTIVTDVPVEDVLAVLKEMCVDEA